MRKPMTSFLLALTLGNTVLAATDTSVNGHLIVRASGFAHAHGHAVAKLFAPGDNVLEAGRWQVTAPIENGFAEFRFPQLPAGSYAVAVFHDENDNGKIDHGLLGPSEPLGFSGGFCLSLFSGRPNFERLKFSFQSSEQTLEVRVQ